MFHRNCCTSKYKDVLRRTDCLRNLYSFSENSIFKTRKQAVYSYDCYIRQRGRDGPNVKHFHNRAVRRRNSTRGVIQQLRHVFDQRRMFKMQLQSGYLLAREDPEKPNREIWKCWYPSKNLRWLLPNQDRGGWVTITSEQDLESLITNIKNTNPISHIRTPDTSWYPPASPILEFALHYYPLKKILFRGVVELPKNYAGRWGHKFLKVNGLCFWYCLSKFLTNKRLDALQTTVKDLFQSFYEPTDTWKTCIEKYEGIHLEELEAVEEKHSIRISVYELQGKDGVLIRASTKKYKRNMLLASYKNHMMLITDARRFNGCLSCPRCYLIFETMQKLTRHCRTCTNSTREETYPKDYIDQFGKVHRPFVKFNSKRTLYRDDLGQYSGFIVWDLESFFRACEFRTEQTVFPYIHEVGSVGLGYRNPNTKKIEMECQLRTGTRQQFFYQFFKKLLEWHKTIVQFELKKHSKRITNLKVIIENGCEKAKKELKMLIGYIICVPLISFNGTGYDHKLLRTSIQELPSATDHLKLIFKRTHGKKFCMTQCLKSYESQDKKAKRPGFNLTVAYVETLLRVTKKV